MTRFADPVRQALTDEVARQGLTLIGLSRTIGRNDSYLAQFVSKGSPRVLPDRDRLHLAMALEIDEVLLGARMPWRPAAPK